MILSPYVYHELDHSSLVGASKKHIWKYVIILKLQFFNSDYDVRMYHSEMFFFSDVLKLHGSDENIILFDSLYG